GDIWPAMVLYWVTGIEGLEISGAPATPQALVASDHDLVDEIAVKVDALIRLSADERKNSARPTTLLEQVDEPTSNTTAPDAAETGSIVPDLAATVESSQTRESCGTCGARHSGGRRIAQK